MPHYTLDELSQLDLQQLDGEPLSTHGFIHRTQEGEAILASTPNVPSCCLGALSKRSQQLYVQGDTDGLQEHQIAYLEGRFSYLRENDQWKMVLREARLIDLKSQHSLTPLLGIVGIVILGVFVLKKSLRV